MRLRFRCSSRPAGGTPASTGEGVPVRGKETHTKLLWVVSHVRLELKPKALEICSVLMTYMGQSQTV
jgi:hypothetical protein